jgi:hypothetical protein
VSAMRIEKRGDTEYLTGAPEECDGCEDVHVGGGACCHHLDGEHLAVAWPGNDGASKVLARWPIEQAAQALLTQAVTPGTAHGAIDSADGTRAWTPELRDGLARDALATFADQEWSGAYKFALRAVASALDLAYQDGFIVGRAAAVADAVRARVATASRSAEDIAREMVSIEYDQERGTRFAFIYDRDTGDAICLEDNATDEGAKASADAIVSALASLIERSRADGATAERERQVATTGHAWTEQSVGTWILYDGNRWIGQAFTEGDGWAWICYAVPPDVEPADGRCGTIEEAKAHVEHVWREQSAAAPLPAQPRDVAGRIRALIQAKAGEWADTDLVDTTTRGALVEIMSVLRHALMDARAGVVPIGRVEYMRSELWIPGRLLVEKAADELEAIVRETQGEQR